MGRTHAQWLCITWLCACLAACGGGSPNESAATVTPPAWTAQDAALAADPDVAVNTSGHSWAIWTELVAGHYVIRARLSTSNQTTTLSQTGEAQLPHIALDAAGNAIAVWAQYPNGGHGSIWAARYSTVNQTWSSPAQVSAANPVADAYSPHVAVDASGNAIVSWYQGDGRTNHFDAWAATYSASQASWAAPTIVSDGVNSAYDCVVALNAAGQGLIAWEQEQGDGTTVSNGPKDV